MTEVLEGGLDDQQDVVVGMTSAATQPAVRSSGPRLGSKGNSTTVRAVQHDPRAPAVGRRGLGGITPVGLSFAQGQRARSGVTAGWSPA